MTAEEFKTDFLENVKADASVSGYGSCAAFTAQVAECLINADVLADFIPAFYSGSEKGRNGRMLRVDGYYLDEIDSALNLIISDFDGNAGRKLTKSQSGGLFNRVSRFINNVYNGSLSEVVEISTPCGDLIDLMLAQKKNISKYRLFLFTDAEMSSAIKTIPALLIGGVPTECQIWDFERLFKVCCSDFGRENIEIDFREYTPKGIPCLEASHAATADYSSYLCVIPGKALADIYDRYGSQLLEGNVRSFLSTKVAVNKKIRETIVKYPSLFFAYNNGISATALDVHLEKTNSGYFIVYAKDFQIINGGQTTASLSNSRYKDKASLDDIYVQMKLTEIDGSDSEKSTELIKNISRSSNSQNKVSDADFFATHPFHIKMEQYSRRMFAPAVGGVQYSTKWFYERARGQYLQEQMRMTPAKKKQFMALNPKKQVIAKTDLAKVRNTWGELPYIVSRGAQTNFLKFAEIISEEWANDNSSFDEIYFQESVALMILFRHLENLIPQQSWYEQGYRANIVTYTIALLHILIKRQFKDMDIDLISIWNKQNVSKDISIVLSSLAEQVYITITDSSRTIANVTQWCKKEACWKSVRGLDFKLPDNFNIALINNQDRIRELRRKSKRGECRKIETEAQNDIYEEISQYDRIHWQKLGHFAERENLYTISAERQAIRNLCADPQERITSLQYQCLLLLIERAQKKGFMF